MYNVYHMLRTQIYLPEDLTRDLKFMAQKEDKPTAQIIRDLLKEGLRKRKGGKSAGETLLELANLGVKGPGDLSTNLFDYLYGKKSDYAKRRKK